MNLPFNTLVPIVFSIIYIAYFFIARTIAVRKGTSYRYKPLWLLVSFVVLGYSIYCLVTGKDITQFLG